MRTTTLLCACLLLILGSTFNLQAQEDERNISSEPQKIIPRSNRFVVSGGIGLLPTFLASGTQNTPVLTGTVQYYLNPRFSLGLAYAQSNSSSEPYIDDNEVQSFLDKKTSHVGARITGSIFRSGPIEFYGGLQVGLNFTNATERHVFPSDFLVESEEAYIAERPSPFGEARTQLAPIGFFGVSVEALPHVHVNTEIGNNLSLITAGLEVRF